MNVITKNTRYAIRALCYISREKGRVVSVSELCDCLKIPRPFLRVLLQRLNREGVLDSFKGKGGGFKLAMGSECISLLKLAVIFQYGFGLIDCKEAKDICSNINKCALRQHIKSIEDCVREKLEKITVASLCREKFEKIE